MSIIGEVLVHYHRHGALYSISPARDTYTGYLNCFFELNWRLKMTRAKYWACHIHMKQAGDNSFHVFLQVLCPVCARNRSDILTKYPWSQLTQAGISGDINQTTLRDPHHQRLLSPSLITPSHQSPVHQADHAMGSQSPKNILLQINIVLWPNRPGNCTFY